MQNMKTYTSRVNFTTEVENKINQTIWTQFCADRTFSNLYCLMSSTGRNELKCDGLVGTIDFFRLFSMRMRVMSERLSKYQTLRGGQVKFDQIKPLVSLPNKLDCTSVVRCCLEVALETEKKVEEQMRELFYVAKEKNDIVTRELIEDVFLPCQMYSIRCLVGKLNLLQITGNAVYTFDRLTMQPLVRKITTCIMRSGDEELERLPMVGGNRFSVMLMRMGVRQMTQGEWNNITLNENAGKLKETLTNSGLDKCDSLYSRQMQKDTEMMKFFFGM